MSGKGYYLGGERDDPSNYSHRESSHSASSLLGKLVAENSPAQDTKKSTPQVKDNFNIDFPFFYSKMNECSPSYSRDYWDWRSFINFAKSTVNLYAQAMSAFYEVVFQQKVSFGYDESVSALKEAMKKQRDFETDFMLQFTYRNRDSLSFINKLAKNRAVLDLSCKAWMACHSIAKKINENITDCGDVFKCAILINTLPDCNGSMKDLEIYRNAKSMQKRLKSLNLSSFFAENHPQELYSTIPADGLINELLTLANGVRIEELPQIISSVREGLVAGELNQFVEFYDNHGNISLVVKNLNKQTEDSMDLFEDEQGNDQYVVANQYLDFCNNLLKKAEEINYRYVNDIKAIINQLCDVVTKLEPNHEEYLQFSAKLDKMVVDMLKPNEDKK